MFITLSQFSRFEATTNNWVLTHSASAEKSFSTLTKTHFSLSSPHHSQNNLTSDNESKMDFFIRQQTQRTNPSLAQQWKTTLELLNLEIIGWWNEMGIPDPRRTFNSRHYVHEGLKQQLNFWYISHALMQFSARPREIHTHAHINLGGTQTSHKFSYLGCAAAYHFINCDPHTRTQFISAVTKILSKKNPPEIFFLHLLYLV